MKKDEQATESPSEQELLAFTRQWLLEKRKNVGMASRALENLAFRADMVKLLAKRQQDAAELDELTELLAADLAEDDAVVPSPPQRPALAVVPDSEPPQPVAVMTDIAEVADPVESLIDECPDLPVSVLRHEDPPRFLNSLWLMVFWVYSRHNPKHRDAVPALSGRDDAPNVLRQCGMFLDQITRAFERLGVERRQQPRATEADFSELYGLLTKCAEDATVNLLSCLPEFRPPRKPGVRCIDVQQLSMGYPLLAAELMVDHCGRLMSLRRMCLVTQRELGDETPRLVGETLDQATACLEHGYDMTRQDRANRVFFASRSDREAVLKTLIESESRLLEHLRMGALADQVDRVQRSMMQTKKIGAQAGAGLSRYSTVGKSQRTKDKKAKSDGLAMLEKELAARAEDRKRAEAKQAERVALEAIATELGADLTIPEERTIAEQALTERRAKAKAQAEAQEAARKAAAAANTGGKGKRGKK